MNIERIKELRDFVATLPESACNMDWWFMPGLSGHDVPKMVEQGFKCGTTACFGGWTEVMMVIKGLLSNEPVSLSMDTEDRPADYLELTQDEVSYLFYSFPELEDKGGHGTAPEEGWKAWMLARLDHAIKIEKIVDYSEFEESREATI